MTVSDDDRAAALTGSGFREELAAALGGRVREVSRVARLAGGASREMWMLDAHTESGVTPLVVRMPPEGSLVDTSIDVELAAYACAARAVPVPRIVVCTGESSALGAGAIVMTRLVGETSLAALLATHPPARRSRIVGQVFRALGALAAVPPDPDEHRLRAGSGISAIGELDYWRERVERARIARPVTSWVIDRLAERPPLTTRAALVHGDYRIGNILFTQHGVTGVLDWELAHWGDPLEDLAWALSEAWRPVSAKNLVGGSLTEQEAIAQWSSRSGIDVDPEALTWWRAFSYVKQNALWMSGVRQYLDGATSELVYAQFGWKNFAREELLMLDALGWNA